MLLHVVAASFMGSNSRIAYMAAGLLPSPKLG